MAVRLWYAVRWGWGRYLKLSPKAICCAIRTDQPHGNTARQVMLPTGTLALLPIANLNQDDQCRWQSIVWTLPKQIAETYLSDYHQNPDSLINRLAFGKRLCTWGYS